MSLHVFDTDVTRKTNEDVIVKVPIYSTEPGILTGSASGCTFPDGATKEITGTRTWARGIAQGFNGPAGASAPTAVRDVVSICWDFDPTKFCDNLQSYSNQIGPLVPIAQNYRNAYAGNNLNWGLGIRPASVTTGTVAQLLYSQSNVGTTPGAVATVMNTERFDAYTRFVLLLNGTNVTLYWKQLGGAKQSNSSGSRVAPTGITLTPLLALYGAARFGFFASLLANDANGVDLWLAGGCPADPVVYYPCNEEVPDSITAAPYDASVNLYDGVFSADATYPLTSAPRVFSDSVTVVPASSIRVLVPAGVASPVTVTLTRPRQGVPSRASDGEKYETASGVITLVDPVTRIKVGPRQIYGVYL